MVESGVCSVAWNTLFPQIAALVCACELIQYWILCLQVEWVWLGSREMGQKTASSLLWYCCLFTASQLLFIKVGLVNQYDGSVSIKFHEIPRPRCTLGRRRLKLTHTTHWRWLGWAAIVYTFSLGVCLCNKNSHVDNLFSCQPPLWSSLYSRPDALSYILIPVPYVHASPAVHWHGSWTLTSRKPLHTGNILLLLMKYVSAIISFSQNNNMSSWNCSENMKSRLSMCISVF